MLLLFFLEIKFISICLFVFAGCHQVALYVVIVTETSATT